jgi:hypothetical protein
VVIDPNLPIKTASVQRSGNGSSLTPFRFPSFTVLWIATVVSNIGTWMQNAAGQQVDGENEQVNHRYGR